jgi:molybdenum cofactor cytidylyltransferase
VKESHGRAAILLAAGAASRMGTAKAALPWRGTTLIEYQIGELLATSIDVLVVVLGCRASEIGARIEPRRIDGRLRILVHAAWDEGKTSSIRAGIVELDRYEHTERRVPWKSVTIVGVDEPRSAATIEAIFAAREASGARIAIPRFEDRRGHPPVFARELRQELLGLDEASQGLRAVVARHAAAAALVEIADPRVLVNLNDPEAYRAAFERFGRDSNLRNTPKCEPPGTLTSS